MLRNWILATLVVVMYASETAADTYRRAIPTECPRRDSLRGSVMLPHESDCTKYYTCVHGRPIFSECPVMDREGNRLHFNPVLQVCDWPFHAGCVRGTRPTTGAWPTWSTKPSPTPTNASCRIPSGDVPDGWFIPHECLCAFYYMCRNGDLIRQECSSGLHFNAKRFSCDYPEAAGCEPLPTTTEATTVKSTTSGIPFQCPTDNSGGTIQFPHPTNCSLFYKCDNGNKQLMQCPNGLHFNPVIQMCDWPDSAGCTATTEPGGTSDDETQPTIPSLETSTKETTAKATIATPTSELPNECPTEDTGSVVQLPHPYNCSLYYVCENGEKVLQACPPGLEFSPDLHICDWPEVSGCLASTTTRMETTTTEATTKPATGTATEATPEPTTEKATEAPPQSTTEIVTEATAQSTSERATEAMQQPSTGIATEATPEPTTEKATEAPPQSTTELATEATAQPTTGSSTEARPQPTTQRETEATQNPTTEPFITVSTIGTTSSELSNECPSEDMGTVAKLPHPYNCSLYYVCENRRKVLQTCPEGLEFSPDLYICVWPEVSGCIASTTEMTEAPPEPTSEGTSRPMTESTVNLVETECPPDNSGMAVHIPHLTNCSLYYKCDNGAKVLQACPAGLEFNAAKQVCDWPDAAGCVASTIVLPSTTNVPVTSSEAPETTATTSQPPSTEVPVTSPQTSSPADECPPDADGRLMSHETNCSLYYECEGGQKILQECTPGLHFSPNLEICVWPANAGCESTTLFPTIIPSIPEVSSQASTIVGNIVDGGDTGCIGTCPARDPADYSVLLPNTDCTKFCECSNSVASVFDCPLSLHFNPTSFVCDFPENAQCGRNVHEY